MTTRAPKRENSFVIVWEFYIHARKRRAFERAYGPQGDWAKLFQARNGYVRTDLVCDLNSLNRYLTLDYWASHREYENFRKENAQAYRAIDRKCEALTTKETKIGEFKTKW
jgi:hypothetical protein